MLLTAMSQHPNLQSLYSASGNDMNLGDTTTSKGSANGSSNASSGFGSTNAPTSASASASASNILSPGMGMSSGASGMQFNQGNGRDGRSTSLASRYGNGSTTGAATTGINQASSTSGSVPEMNFFDHSSASNSSTNAALATALNHGNSDLMNLQQQQQQLLLQQQLQLQRLQQQQQQQNQQNQGSAASTAAANDNLKTQQQLLSRLQQLAALQNVSGTGNGSGNGSGTQISQMSQGQTNVASNSNALNPATLSSLVNNVTGGTGGGGGLLDSSRSNASNLNQLNQQQQLQAQLQAQQNLLDLSNSNSSSGRLSLNDALSLYQQQAQQQQQVQQQQLQQQLSNQNTFGSGSNQIGNGTSGNANANAAPGSNVMGASPTSQSDTLSLLQQLQQQGQGLNLNQLQMAAAASAQSQNQNQNRVNASSSFGTSNASTAATALQQGQGSVTSFPTASPGISEALLQRVGAASNQVSNQSGLGNLGGSGPASAPGVGSLPSNSLPTALVAAIQGGLVLGPNTNTSSPMLTGSSGSGMSMGAMSNGGMNNGGMSNSGMNNSKVPTVADIRLNQLLQSNLLQQYKSSINAGMNRQDEARLQEHLLRLQQEEVTMKNQLMAANMASNMSNMTNIYGVIGQNQQGCQGGVNQNFNTAGTQHPATQHYFNNATNTNSNTTNATMSGNNMNGFQNLDIIQSSAYLNHDASLVASQVAGSTSSPPTTTDKRKRRVNELGHVGSATKKSKSPSLLNENQGAMTTFTPTLNAVAAAVTTTDDSSTGSDSPYQYSTSMPLGIASDRLNLIPLHCFIRQYCIEIFTADETEVFAPNKTKFSRGQIGIRCAFCHVAHKTDPENFKWVRGCTYFPRDIASIYNATMNLIQRHTVSLCSYIPDDVRRRYMELKSNEGRSGSSKKYWVESAKRLGLVDSPSGIRMLKQTPSSPLQGSSNSGRQTSDQNSGSNICLPVADDSTTSRNGAYPNQSTGLGSSLQIGEQETQQQSDDICIPVVSAEDRAMSTSFSFLLFQQMRACSFTEADRVGKRSRLKVGFSGIACIHCYGAFGSGRYFPSSLKSMADTSKTLDAVYAHMMKCFQCPMELKLQLKALRCQHAEERSHLRFGSQKVFFSRIWDRLRKKDRGELNVKQEQVVATTSTTAPAELETAKQNAPPNNLLAESSSGTIAATMPLPQVQTNHNTTGLMNASNVNPSSVPPPLLQQQLLNSGPGPGPASGLIQDCYLGFKEGESNTADGDANQKPTSLADISNGNGNVKCENERPSSDASAVESV